MTYSEASDKASAITTEAASKLSAAKGVEIRDLDLETAEADERIYKCAKCGDAAERGAIDTSDKQRYCQT